MCHKYIPGGLKKALLFSVNVMRRVDDYVFLSKAVVVNQGSAELRGSASTVQGLYKKLRKSYDRQEFLILVCICMNRRSSRH